MTLEQLAEKTDECAKAGWDVRAMRSSDVFDRSIPTWVRDVLRYDLVRRWSRQRAFEIEAAAV
jgi:hypothetical protein